MTGSTIFEVRYYYTVLPLSVLPSVRQSISPSVRQSVSLSVSPSVPWIFFVTFFSETTLPGFLKFGFRLDISQLYCVMRFQIHHPTTSCLPNTFQMHTWTGVSSVSRSSQFHLFYLLWVFMFLLNLWQIEKKLIYLFFILLNHSNNTVHHR